MSIIEIQNIDRALEGLLNAVSNIDRCKRRIVNIDDATEIRVKLTNIEDEIMDTRDELRTLLLY